MSFLAPLLTEIFAPITRRMSGYAGTYLTAIGLTAAEVSTVVAAIPIVIGVCIDLLLSYSARGKR